MLGAMKLIAMIAEQAPPSQASWDSAARADAYRRVLAHVEGAGRVLAAAAPCQKAEAGDWSFELDGEHVTPVQIAGRAELTPVLRAAGGQATLCRLLARPADPVSGRLVLDLVAEAETAPDVARALAEHG